MRHASHAGITTLEAALVSLFLCALLLGGFGVTDYLQQLQYVNALVEQALDDSAVKPFKIRAVSLDAPELNQNSEALRRYIVAVIDRVESNLRQKHYAEYFIEAKFSAADIDPRTGSFLGLDTNASFSQERGSMRVPPEVLKFSDLQVRFAQLASVSQTQGDLAGASLLAIPTISFENSTHGTRFLENSFLAGLRVFASLQGTLAGSAYQHLGLDPVVESYKVVQLRGVVE